MRLKVGSATSVGRVRPINEDAFLARADQGLFVVCDGMGGAASGEVASQMAVETVGAYAENHARDRAAANGFQPRTVQLGFAIEAANRAILERSSGNSEHAGMGTTVVGAWLGDGIASIAHVGDSRAYISNQEGFEAVTSDHSLVEAQVQAGLIDREQSLKSAHQNVLLRALGRDPDVQVELGEVPIGAGDRLLLCTDGLTRMVTDAALAEVLTRFRGDPQGACDYLVATANDNGGPDNVTVVIVEVRGSRFGQVLKKVWGS